MASIDKIQVQGTGYDIIAASANTAKAYDSTFTGTDSIKSALDGKENTSNKVSSWGSTPSDSKYPSEKLVKDSLDASLSYFDATWSRANASGNGWKKIADIDPAVRTSSDITGAWDVVLYQADGGFWRESITLDVRYHATGSRPYIRLFNRCYESDNRANYNFCVKVTGLVGTGNSNIELWAYLPEGWYSLGIREVGSGAVYSKKTIWNYYSYISAGGGSKPEEDLENNVQVKDATYFGHVKSDGGSMTGPLQGYLMSTRSTMVGNEYNCLLNAKERGILTFTQSGSGQLTTDQVWELFDGKIIPAYGTAIDQEDPYVLTIDLSRFINQHCQVFSAFGWTCRYWEPIRFKVELYNVYQSANTWVTICDYSQTNYTGQYSGGDSTSLFVKFGSGTVNPHTGEMRGGIFNKIRITIWKGNESTNKWGISEIFYCYPENYTVYSGLRSYSSTKLTTARNLAVSLSNTSTDTPFDGSANLTNIKTTGTLGIGNGGTGATTANDAANALLSGLPAWTADPTDYVKLIRRDTGGTAAFGQVTFLTVWNYIKNKISSVLGLTATSYGGNAATASAAATGSALETAINNKQDKITYMTPAQETAIIRELGDL